MSILSSLEKHFYKDFGVTFDVEHDSKLAIRQDDFIIKEICSVANDYAVAVSFGFIEKSEDIFYSSQVTIDSHGKVIDVKVYVQTSFSGLYILILTIINGMNPSNMNMLAKPVKSVIRYYMLILIAWIKKMLRLPNAVQPILEMEISIKKFQHEKKMS